MKTDNALARLKTAGLLLACAPALAGCQFFGFGKGLASFDAAEAMRPLPEDFGAEQLAAGRDALKAERTSEAIDSFMLAKLYPQHAAEAFNGLAVAYSRLGRSDLTEKYFQVAVALAPQDERFRSNLAKFYDHNGISRTALQDLASLAPIEPSVNEPTFRQLAQLPAETPEIVVVARRTAVETHGPGSRLERISPREVHLTEAEAGSEAARLGKLRRENRSGVASREAYPIRIRLPGPSPEGTAADDRDDRPNYPVRIVLSDVRGSASSATR